MRLVVFFSRGMSLEGWRRAGILDRELALYRALRPHLEHLALVTYGGAEECALAAKMTGLPGIGIEVLPNRWRLPSNLYSVVAPFLHRRALRRATIFKSNQLNGAWCAVIAKHLFGKALIVRCGFLWSDFVARLHAGSWRATVARRLERRACRAADAVIVAAAADRDTIVHRYGLEARRVHVVPNYVDTSVFRPMPELSREAGRIIFIGRLEDQKNVMALVGAVEDLPGATLTIVGDGGLRERLEAAAARRPGTVTFLGRLAQEQLPALLNQSAVFVLPSHYEGNPKALVEAMACGLPVVAARRPGIEEIVRHGETGYLCGTSAEEIRTALRDVLNDAALCDRIGAGGLAYARSHCSLEAAVGQELGILQSLEARA